MGVRAVFFDVGETLVDETSVWNEWADWLGVPRFTFAAVLGGAIERGEDHLGVFERFRPGFDLERERALRREAGRHWRLAAEDLHPDVVPCLRTRKDDGYRVGISGNQPEGMSEAIRALDLPVDVVANSADWGVTKPSPAFFLRVAEVSGTPPGQIAYVGDRVDNDVVPSHEAGMVSVFLRRGPWGFAQERWPEANVADIRLDSLDGLAARLRELPGPPAAAGGHGELAR
jgi:FMN phosphatase YigB (HAD superfamily)